MIIFKTTITTLLVLILSWQYEKRHRFQGKKLEEEMKSVVLAGLLTQLANFVSPATGKIK